MSDIQILKQLLNGYHLEPKELQRAKTIIKNLEIEASKRKF